MRIIDIHTHCNCGSVNDVPSSPINKSEFDFLMQEHKSSGILCGGFSYYSGLFNPDEIYESNELLFQQSQKDERVYQWLVIDPRQEKLFEQIAEKIQNKKVLGIKVHSPMHAYDIEEYGDKIFSFANDLNCVVLMHNDKIGRMVNFADKYPNMKLIIAHLGTVEHVEAIKSAKHGNIYTDTSGGLSYLNNIVEYAVEQVGSEKIFFGTDTYACGFQRGRIEYARISDSDKENIFFNNAKKHFSEQFKNL